MARHFVLTLAGLAISLAGAGTAQAGEALLAVTAGTAPQVLVIDSAVPGEPLARATVTGLVVGETINGIDVRPSTGELFALTSTNRMLLLDPRTGFTRQLGAPLDALVVGLDVPAGFDFNPTVDRLRVVNSARENMRYNPVTAAHVDGDIGTAGIQGDTDLAYIATDPNVGTPPAITASAYDRNDNDGATATTLLGVDSGLNNLVRQGAVDGNAADVAGGASPNGGLLTTLGPLGVDATGVSGFDIGRSATGTEAGWAALQPLGAAVSNLYSINVSPTVGGPARTTTVGAMTDLVTGLSVVRQGLVRPVAVVSGSEGGQAAVLVERIGDTLDPVTLNVRTTDGTATAGADYTPTSSVVTFASGQRTATVTIPIAADGVVEGPQTFAVDFSATSPGTYLLRASTTVEITEPDTVRPVLLIAPVVPDTLRALRRSGALRVDFSCSEACSTRTTVRVGTAVIATGLLVRTSAGVSRVTVRLSAAGRKRLDALIKARGGKVALKVTTTATDTSGNAATRAATLRLVRR